MIRPMKASDLPAVAALEQTYFSVPWTLKSLEESLARPEYLFLTAELDGCVAGYAGLLQIQDEGDVTNIVVDEAYRGRGLGTALVETLLAEGRQHGLAAFTLEVRVGNTSAIRLYERLGFVCEGRRKNFYERPTEDALIMWKRFPISLGVELCQNETT